MNKSTEPLPGKRSQSSGPDEAYDFRCHGPWDNDLRVAIARTGDAITLTAVVRYGYEEMARGYREREVTKALTLADWDRLQGRLRKAEFWGHHEHYNFRGLDGWTWCVGGRRASIQHEWREWCPPPGPYHDLGRFFTELAGFEMPWERC